MKKYIFLLLLFLFLLLISSKNIFSQNNNLVKLSIIGKNFFKTYYINFSSIDSSNSFKIYDI